MKMKHFFPIALAAFALAIAGCDKEKGNQTPAEETGPGSIAKENLVAYFPFESEAASISKGDGITFKAAQGAASFAPGKNGNAYKGSESAAYLEYDLASTNVIKSLKAFTFAAWINTAAAVGGAASIVSIDGGDPGQGSVNIVSEGNSDTEALDMKVYLYNTATNWKAQDVRSKDAVFTPSKWMHFVYTYDDATSGMNIYVNGEFFTESIRYADGDPDGEDGPEVQPLLGSLTLDPAMAHLYIGAWPNLAKGASPEAWMVYYAGQLDELRIYNKGLSATQIKALYVAELAAATK